MTNLLRYVKVLLVFVCVSASGTAFADICDGCEEYQPPIAVDDVATTNENTPVTINVLANDINPYNSPLYIARKKAAKTEIGSHSLPYTFNVK